METQHLVLYVFGLTTCLGSLANAHNIVTVKVNGNITLPCKYEKASSGTPHVEWVTISQTVFERRGKESFQGPGYEGRVDVPEGKLLEGNCSLQIMNIQPSDAGIYGSYLLVNRAKRSAGTRRFIREIELSVEERHPTEQSEKRVEHFVPTGDAQINCLHKLIIISSVIPCFLFHFL